MQVDHPSNNPYASPIENLGGRQIATPDAGQEPQSLRNLVIIHIVLAIGYTAAALSLFLSLSSRYWYGWVFVAIAQALACAYQVQGIIKSQAQINRRVARIALIAASVLPWLGIIVVAAFGTRNHKTQLCNSN